MTFVVAEDHWLYRDTLVAIVEKHLGGAVIAATDCWQEAARICVDKSVDLLLLDLELTDGDGFAAAEIVRRESPRTRVVALTGFVTDYTIVQAQRLGVSGLLDKTTASWDELIRSLRTILNGGTVVSEGFRALKRERSADPAAFSKRISEREEQVVGLCGLGLSDAEVGARLGISEHTARTHRHRVLRKLGLPNSVALAVYAFERGFARVFRYFR